PRGLGALAGAPAGGARRVATLATLVVGAAVGWALLGVAIPSLFPDGDRLARVWGARGVCEPIAVPGRRPHRAPARARRLLERARAACRRGARARPLGGP